MTFCLLKVFSVGWMPSYLLGCVSFFQLCWFVIFCTRVYVCVCVAFFVCVCVFGGGVIVSHYHNSYYYKMLKEQEKIFQVVRSCFVNWNYRFL